MRNHDTQHLLVRPSRVAERFVREPDRPLRQVGSSFAHHSFSVFGMLAPLLVLALAVLLLVGVWGRRRLAAQGRWFGVRLGEQVSRAAVESLMSTLAGGLPRPLFGPAPWVTLTLSSTEDRAACHLFVSGGVPVAQVRAAVEQGLGGVTVDAIGRLGPLDLREHARVASLAPGGSRFLPLRVDHRVDPAGQLLAALRAHEPGEGGVIQLVLQAPPRSAANRARGQARRLRAGRGLQPGLALRALRAFGGLLLELIDVFLPGSPPAAGQQVRRVDPFSLERAKAIEAKAAQPLLAATLRAGAWADDRRRAGGRLGGLLAAFGQFHDLGGLHKGLEPFCKLRALNCLPAIRPRLLLSSSEAAALLAVPEETALAPLSFSEAPSRRIAPAAHAPSRGLLLGHSTAAQFESNPGGCPAASIVGHAKATTPSLPVPLTGPAYFVSHGGEAFPSLIVVLQGYGVTVDLVGTTFISKAGITSSTFKSVPDVPVGSFELTLPQGKFSALTTNGNLCKSKLAMPTAFVAQNGAVIHQSTKIAATGCPKKKAKKASSHRHGKGKARKKR